MRFRLLLASVWAIPSVHGFAPSTRCLSTPRVYPDPSTGPKGQVQSCRRVRSDISLQSATRSNRSIGSKLKVPKLDEETSTSLSSAAAFIVLDIIFRKLFDHFRIAFPSSLAGCAALFATLLALPRKRSEAIFQKLTPGADLLAKWLPVLFVPSLVTLPLADGLDSSAELLKVGFVVVGGFFFTLLTTAFSVVGVRNLLADKTDGDSVVDEATDETDAVGTDDLPDDTIAQAKPVSGFSPELLRNLSILTAASGACAVATSVVGLRMVSRRLSALCMLSATLNSFVFGSRFPAKLKKVVHPLVTCTALTWALGNVLAPATGRTFRKLLKSYRTGSLNPIYTGAGDILLFLLGPAVVSLAISMYGRRKLMRDNLAAVGTSVGVSTVGGAFGTALAVRLLAISNPFLRLSLLSRNITSPLAISIAGILGADISLAVSIVVVTGLIGANFGASILDMVGVKDAVARGLGIGAAAHGLGTAAFANDKDAFPFAAIAMALTASAATVTVSVPVLRKIIIQLALGG